MGDIRKTLYENLKNKGYADDYIKSNYHTIDSLLKMDMDESYTHTITWEDFIGVFYSSNTEKDFWNGELVYDDESIFKKLGNQFAGKIRFIDFDGEEYVFTATYVRTPFGNVFFLGDNLFSRYAKFDNMAISLYNLTSPYIMSMHYYIPIEAVKDIKSTKNAFINGQTLIDIMYKSPWRMRSRLDGSEYPICLSINNSLAAEFMPFKDYVGNVYQRFTNAAAAINVITKTETGVDVYYTSSTGDKKYSLTYAINLPEYIQEYPQNSMARSRSAVEYSEEERIEYFKNEFEKLGLDPEIIDEYFSEKELDRME